MQQHVFISQGIRPWWHTLIAALGYTTTFVVLYFVITKFNDNGRRLAGFAFIATYAFMTGIRYSMVIHYHFNFDTAKYKIEKSVGFIRYGRWKTFEKLGYIAVYNMASGFYNVNLWHEGDQYITLSAFEDVDKALEMGKEFAEKMNVDLLDASGGPHDSNWVDV
jgi:hypothetical protein